MANPRHHWMAGAAETALHSLPEGSPVNLFISHSSEDVKLKDRLVQHLSALNFSGGVNTFADDGTLDDAGYRESAGEALDGADAILLLISAKYLAAPFLKDERFCERLARHERSGRPVIPIILRSCHWQSHPQLSARAALPRDGALLAANGRSAQDQAFANITGELGQLFSLRSRPDQAAAPGLTLPSVPLQPVYVSRQLEERTAVDLLRHPGVPIVIFGPARSGKSAMLTQVLAALAAQDRQAGRSGRIVRIDLGAFDDMTRESCDALCRELANRIVQQTDSAEAAVVRVRQSWGRPGNPVSKLGNLLDALLTESPDRLMLALERGDAAMPKPVAQSFFGMLRSWADAACAEPWSRLRLAVEVSLRPALVCPMSGFFNRVMEIRLDDLAVEQVEQLIAAYGMHLSAREVDHMMRLIGGHPHLWHLTLQAAQSGTPWAALKDEELLATQVLAAHCDALRSWLAGQGLVQAMQQHLRNPEKQVRPEEYERLSAAGCLVRREGVISIRYPIYQHLLRPRPSPAPGG